MTDDRPEEGTRADTELESFSELCKLLWDRSGSQSVVLCCDTAEHKATCVGRLYPPYQKCLCKVSVEGGSWRFHISVLHMTSHWKTRRYIRDILKCIKCLYYNFGDVSRFIALCDRSTISLVIVLSAPYPFYTPLLMVVLCISGYKIVKFLWDSHTEEDRKQRKTHSNIWGHLQAKSGKV